MKRTITALTLAALALLTSACSDNSGSGDSNVTNPGQTAPQSTPRAS